MSINIDYRELELKYLTSVGRETTSRLCSSDGFELLSGDVVRQIALVNENGRVSEIPLSEAVVLIEENGVLYLLEADEIIVGISLDKIVKVPERGSYLDVEFDNYNVTFEVVEQTNGYTGGEVFFDKLRAAYERSI